MNTPMLSQAGQEFLELAKQGGRWLPVLGVYALLFWIIELLPVESETTCPVQDKIADAVPKTQENPATIRSILEGAKALIH